MGLLRSPAPTSTLSSRSAPEDSAEPSFADLLRAVDNLSVNLGGGGGEEKYEKGHWPDGNGGDDEAEMRSDDDGGGGGSDPPDKDGDDVEQYVPGPAPYVAPPPPIEPTCDDVWDERHAFTDCADYLRALSALCP
jgi:hypothetical protein